MSPAFFMSQPCSNHAADCCHKNDIQIPAADLLNWRTNQRPGESRMQLVILDRDGVINEDSDTYIKSVDEFIPLPGSLAAIARLNQAGYTIAVATNQSGISRGLFDLNTLDAMHDKLRRLLANEGGVIDKIVFCPHAPDNGCNCRKPLPGLMQQIADHYQIPLTDVPVIGDSLRDLQAARAVGAQPILVKTGKGLRTLAAAKELTDAPVYANLAAAVDALIYAQTATQRAST